MSKLAENLKFLRKRADLNQNDIADVIGVKRSSYAYYESGKTSPKIDALIKIAKLYNITVDEILGDLSLPVLTGEGNSVGAYIPPYEDSAEYRIQDKFNDLSEYEKKVILNVRLMSPDEKEAHKQFLNDIKNNKK